MVSECPGLNSDPSLAWLRACVCTTHLKAGAATYSSLLPRCLEEGLALGSVLLDDTACLPDELYHPKIIGKDKQFLSSARTPEPHVSSGRGSLLGSIRTQSVVGTQYPRLPVGWVGFSSSSGPSAEPSIPPFETMVIYSIFPSFRLPKSEMGMTLHWVNPPDK